MSMAPSLVGISHSQSTAYAQLFCIVTLSPQGRGTRVWMKDVPFSLSRTREMGAWGSHTGYVPLSTNFILACSTSRSAILIYAEHSGTDPDSRPWNFHQSGYRAPLKSPIATLKLCPAWILLRNPALIPSWPGYRGPLTWSVISRGPSFGDFRQHRTSNRMRCGFFFSQVPGRFTRLQ